MIVVISGLHWCWTIISNTTIMSAISLLSNTVTIFTSLITVWLFWKILIEDRRARINDNQYSDIREFTFEHCHEIIKKEFESDETKKNDVLMSFNNYFVKNYSKLYHEMIEEVYKDFSISPRFAKNDNKWYDKNRRDAIQDKFANIVYWSKFIRENSQFDTREKMVFTDDMFCE